MLKRIRPWRLRRRLASAGMTPGEDIAAFERLPLGSWWARTDSALYLARERKAQVVRVPMNSIDSVDWTPRKLGVTIRTATGVHFVNTSGQSDIAEQLIHLKAR